MKMPRKLGILFAVMMVVLLLFSGCSSVSKTTSDKNSDTETASEKTNKTNETTPDVTSKKPVILRFAFFKGGFGSAWQAWLKATYEAKNPHVTIVLEGDPKFRERIQPEIEMGTDVPDILMGSIDNAQMYFQQGKLADLEQLLDREIPGRGGKKLRELITIPDALLQYKDTEKTGKQFGIPMSIGPSGIIINQDIFKKLGIKYAETWEDFISMCDEIKSKGVAPITYPGIYPGYLECFMDPAFVQELGLEKFREWQNPSSDKIFSDEAILRLYERLELFLKREWLLPGTQALDHTQSQMEFVNGKVAMIINGSWLENEMSKVLPLEGVNWSMKPIPYPKNAPLAKATYKVSVGEPLFISSTSKNLDVAYDFAAFMFSPDAAKMWAELSGGFMPVQVDTSNINLTPFQKSMIDLMNESTDKVFPVVFNVSVFTQSPEGPAGVDYGNFMSGKVTPKQVYERKKVDGAKTWHNKRKDLGLE